MQAVTLYSWWSLSPLGMYLHRQSRRYLTGDGYWTDVDKGLFYHKGITGGFKWSEEDDVYHGKLLDTTNCLSMYHGDSLEDCRLAFVEAVEDYLEEYRYV